MRDLIKDLELISKATPGPWETEYGAGYCVINEDVIVCSDIWQNDADFIAAAREGWPYAIERAIKAEAEVERLRKVDSRLAIKHQKLHEEQQSEINRLLLACETMQEQGRQYQESNAALQAKLDNAIDTAFDLEAENAKLRKALELAVDDAIHGANTGWEAKDYLGAACELESEGE